MDRKAKFKTGIQFKLDRNKHKLRHFLGDFARQEDGVMLAFVLFLLLIMMTVGGVSVDLMRAEMERTRLQQTLDSAALAAAHKDNTLDPKTVVLDYFSKANLASYISSDDVQVEGVAGNRAVEIRLDAKVKTQFLGNIGFDEFKVPAAGRAEQEIGDAEVSLVLDISGSMKDNNRMTNLHKAAKDFIDTVLTAETRDRVSLSLVPYTGDVNAGREIFARLNARHLHDYSYCLQFTPADFTRPGIDPEDHYLQGQHFSHTDGSFTNISCPTQSYETITPFSQNVSALKTQIGKLTWRERTSVHVGMKWGAALVDPDIEPVITSMASAGLVDNAFSGRPASYDTPTLKTVVLMTDGVNTTTYRIKDFAYDTPDMRYHWARHPVENWDDQVDGSVESELFEPYYDNAIGNTLLQSVCTAAKNKGIIIWTVGFEINDSAATQLERCASSDSHFYRVEGLEIGEAFASIARQLKQLRLTL
ncbi:MAG: pilus assembly protein TadG-related protein [Pseudooceanicola atlanticus]